MDDLYIEVIRFVLRNENEHITGHIATKIRFESLNYTMYGE